MGRHKHGVRRAGFTLVEVVVVLLILGILAVIAAGRFFKVRNSADENSLRTTLQVVRDAIDHHRAANGGSLPGEQGSQIDFKGDLAPYLRRFPSNPLKKSDTVDIQTSGTNLISVGGGYGWRYDNKTGQFIANSNGTASDGVSRYYEW